MRKQVWIDLDGSERQRKKKTPLTEVAPQSHHHHHHHYSRAIVHLAAKYTEDFSHHHHTIHLLSNKFRCGGRQAPPQEPTKPRHDALRLCLRTMTRRRKYSGCSGSQGRNRGDYYPYLCTEYVSTVEYVYVYVWI